jgi:hypothetical protein
VIDLAPHPLGLQRVRREQRDEKLAFADFALDDAGETPLVDIVQIKEYIDAVVCWDICYACDKWATVSL